MCVPLVDWYVVFFEACRDKSPTEAGVDMFGLSLSFSLVPLVGGIVVKKTGKYVLPTFVGWVLTVVGMGLLTTLHANSSLSKSVVFQIITGSGVGIAYVVLVFPILAAIPVTQTAPAMALYVFSRNFGYVKIAPHSVSPPAHCANKPRNCVDLGHHHRRRHLTERAEEKAARLVPCAVSAGCRDRICDDTDHSDAGSAVQRRGAEYLC